MRPWLEQIKVALSSSEPVCLERIAQEHPWTSLPAMEREQIAHELSQEAVRCMDEQGELRATRLFDLALSIAPVSAKVFLIQGVAFYQRAQISRQGVWAERAIERLSKAATYATQVGMEHIWLLKSYVLYYELHEKIESLEQAKQLWLSLPTQGVDVPYEAQRQAVGGKLWFLLAKNSGEPSDFQQAATLLRLAITCLPLSCELYIDLGHCLVNLARALGHKILMKEAISCFEKVLEVDTLDRAVLMQLASSLYDLYLQTGHRHLARKSRQAFERAFEITRPNVKELDAYAGLAMLLAEIEPMPASLKRFFSYVKALKHDSVRLQLLQWHGRWLLAHQQELFDRLRTLERELQACEEKLQSDAHYWMLRGLCRLSQAQYFRESHYLVETIEFFQKGLAIDHDRPGIWMHLGRAYLLHSELMGDLESSKKASQLFAMAVVCGRYSEEFWIDWAVAFFRLADASGDRTSLSETLVRLEKALEMVQQEGLGPNYRLLYLYGSALDLLGDLQRDEESYEKSVQVLQLVVAAQPQDEEAKNALAVALTHLGESSSRLDILEKGNEIFTALCEVDHEDDYLWNEWGVCLLSMARVKKEEEVATALATQEGPSSDDYNIHAIAKLTRSYQLGNQHALYNLSCAYALKEDFPRAVSYLARALEVGVHPPVEDIMEDEWLEPLRNLPSFCELMQAFEKSEDELEEESELPELESGEEGDLLNS